MYRVRLIVSVNLLSFNMLGVGNVKEIVESISHIMVLWHSIGHAF